MGTAVGRIPGPWRTGGARGWGEWGGQGPGAQGQETEREEEVSVAVALSQPQTSQP